MTGRILVVDDDVDVANTAALVLRKAGHTVAVCHSGRDALEQAAEGFDLILLDINMPGMDGWEVLRILKADPGTMAIPVAMFSVRGEVRDRVHGMQNGALDYINKPFSVDDLGNRVGTLLHRSAGGA